MFKKAPTYSVVVERDLALPRQDDAAAIAGLNGHPGWEAMLRRIRFQRKVLEARLKKASRDDFEIIQVALRCWEYLEEEFNRATKAVTARRIEEPTADELEEFKKIDAFIERVGSPQD